MKKATTQQQADVREAAVLSLDETADALFAMGVTATRMSWQAVAFIERRALRKVRAEVLRRFGASAFPKLMQMVQEDARGLAAESDRRRALYRRKNKAAAAAVRSNGV